MAHHPKLLNRFTVFTGTFLTDSTLPHRDRELLTLRAWDRTGTDYYFGHHVRLGEAAGIDRELALAVADPDFHWSAEDALLLRAADELTAQNGLSDPRWNALAERYENCQLIELLFVVGFYRMVCCYVNTLRVQREPDVPPIPRRKTWTTPGDQFARGTPRKAAQPPHTGPTSFITAIPAPMPG
jgi:4-carboxymuconolactone decarboxylase